MVFHSQVTMLVYLPGGPNAPRAEVSVAELLCEGLAASAAAGVELEPLGEALEPWAVDSAVGTMGPKKRP